LIIDFLAGAASGGLIGIINVWAWMNAWNAGAAQMVTNDFVPIDYGGIVF
jgi:hypothetical protein